MNELCILANNNFIKTIVKLLIKNQMRNILIIGAGRSSSSLIKYLLDKSSQENLHITVGDISKEEANKKLNNHPNSTAIKLDVFNESERRRCI